MALGIQTDFGEIPMMNKLSRREFYKASASLVGVFAAVHRQAAASDSTPSDRLGVAIIGQSTRGKAHIEGFAADPRVDIRVVVDVDSTMAAKGADLAEQFTGKRPTILSDVRQAIDRTDIDIITVATPNHWHAVMGLWAMQAGKDVYLEKPISHNVTEGRTLVDATKKYGRILQTGTQMRSSQGVTPMIDAISAGEIGEVNFARGLCYKRRKSIGQLGSYPIPQPVDYDLWSGPAPDTTPQVTRQRFHYDWHWQRHYGNGDSGNQGPHQTDVARWGLGLQRHPSSVVSYGGRLGYKAERKNADYIDAGDTANTQVSIYDYGDKTIVFETRGLDCSSDCDKEINELLGKVKGNQIGVIFYGSEGYAVQGGDFFSAKLFDKNRKQVKEFIHDPATAQGLNVSHMTNFVDAVIARDASILHADATCGHLSASIAHLGNISYYLGDDDTASPEDIESAIAKIKSRDDNAETLMRTLNHLRENKVDLSSEPLSLGPMLAFDNDTERFTNNEAANQLLTREYSEGFELPTVS
jgi:predicted dehydrogenase